MQAHERAVARAAGGRTALNLAGVAPARVGRGQCVVRRDDGWEVTDRLDVSVQVLPDAARPLRTRGRLQAFLGTAEVAATCVLLTVGELAPGARGYAQLRLARPVPAAPGDRIVLRSSERRTIGGAVVVDASPARHGRGGRAAERLAVLERGRPVQVLAQRLRDAGRVGLVDADPAAVAATGGVVVGGVALAAHVADAAREALLAALAAPVSLAAARAATGLGPAAAAGLVEEVVATGDAVREGPRLRAVGAQDPAAAALETVARALAEGGLRPPSPGRLAETSGLPAGVVQEALARLRERGRAVRAGDMWFDAAAVLTARDGARAALADGPMAIGALRDLWGVGRRHAVALAADLDASGLTRRQGELRALRREREGPVGR